MFVILYIWSDDGQKVKRLGSKKYLKWLIGFLAYIIGDLVKSPLKEADHKK